VKKVVIFLIVSVVLFPLAADARRGCCSHHGGVAGCSSSGRQICADGTLSPTCTCTSTAVESPKPSYVYGCTDSSAINYNSSANVDDGSCIEKRLGCMDVNAVNYDLTANTDDNSCKYKKKVVEKVALKYEIKYKKNTKKEKNTRRVITAGKDGEKEIIYEEVVDKYGNVISKDKLSENIVTVAVPEVVEIGTKENDDIFSFVWLISLIIVFVYAAKNKKENLLVNKISMQDRYAKIMLYILYVIFVIPVFIDIFIIIYYRVKNVN